MGPGIHRTGVVGPLIKRYFRAKVRGLESFPATGGALVVSNHSGGMLTPDVLIFAPAFYKRFGYSRPGYTLSHWGVLMGPTSGLLRRIGVIEANRENANKALRSGAVVLVFPGGDYDSYRPTSAGNVIDFGGRTGYVRTAIAAGVPIVPAVSIGGQESQLFLARGDSIAAASWAQAPAPHRDPPGEHWVPVERFRLLPAQSAATEQNRHPSARTGRRRRRIRCRRRRR